MSSIVFFLLFIPYVKKKKIKQFERLEGPQSHKIKEGTPTMGGIPLFLSFFISVILYGLIDGLNSNIFLLLMPVFGYFIIGFIDDYLIVKQHKNDGLAPSFKMILELIIASIFFYLYLSFGGRTYLNLFGYYLDIKWVYGLFILVFFTASSNAVNLTDGLDGLSGGLVFIGLLAFLTISIIDEEFDVTLIIISMLFSLLGFLIFNHHPAKIFMGDTGSLPLGVFLASVSIMLKKEILLLIIGFPFVVETLSVIIQVIYFKLTNGKRIFKMTPIHHHFELKGNSEIKVVYSFYILGIIFGIVGIMVGIYFL